MISKYIQRAKKSRLGFFLIEVEIQHLQKEMWRHTTKSQSVIPHMYHVCIHRHG